MKNFKAILGVSAGLAMAVFAVVAMAHADTALTVSCSGAVSGNQITWTASPSGGNAPYALAWSGSGGIAGATSTSATSTYSANGTYTSTIQVTDASSTVATSTCSGTVTSFPPATSTLNVFLGVNNNAGGSAVSGNFAVTVSGANASPSSFAGSNSGSAVTVNASTSYSIGVSSIVNYSETTSGNCTGPIAASSTGSCTITETYVAPTSTPPVTPTSTPALPRANPPQLTISPSGSFLARGTIVTSVSSGSFEGSVWGITYTVDWSGNLFPEFYFRHGDGGDITTNPVTQLKVGDEVGVSGRIESSSSPMIVNANVVRDYSILALRPVDHEDNGKGNDGEDNGQGNGNGVSNNASASFNLSARLQDLLSQFHNLQSLFEGHGNGNGNGDSQH